MDKAQSESGMEDGRIGMSCQRSAQTQQARARCERSRRAQASVALSSQFHTCQELEAVRDAVNNRASSLPSQHPYAPTCLMPHT